MRAPKLTQIVGLDSMARFRVMEAGEYAGKFFRVGEVVECRKNASVGETIVLVAKGAGRPRLGRVTLDGLLGDGDEPCSPGRWYAIGAVIRVIPHRGDSSRHFCQALPARFMKRRGVVPVRREVQDTPQLRLFAA
jgi:hypothetical protein